MPRPLIVVLTSLLASCAWIDVAAPTMSSAQLLSGQLLFGDEVQAADPIDPMAMTGEMRAWVDAKTSGFPHAKSRMRKLLDGLVDDGLLTLEYDPNHSLTASETFTRHQGNCLSFSLLFVALAREADLNARFQLVSIPPSFSKDGELVMLNNHINVRIEDVRSDTNFVQDHVVDFNSAEYNGNYDTRKVSDDYAVGLHHGNVAVEALGRGDHRAAFRQLKRGIEVSPTVPGLWTNLGVLYARNGKHAEAEQAYKHALSLDGRNKSALTNLARTTRLLGRADEAAMYERRVQRFLSTLR